MPSLGNKVIANKNKEEMIDPNIQMYFQLSEAGLLLTLKYTAASPYETIPIAVTRKTE